MYSCSRYRFLNGKPMLLQNGRVFCEWESSRHSFSAPFVFQFDLGSYFHSSPAISLPMNSKHVMARYL